MALVQSEGQSISNTPTGVGFNPELVMTESTQGNPQDNNHKTRSWKRLVQDINPTETQPVPFMKKRLLRDNKDSSDVVHAGKKLCANSLPTVEAARQPRRKP